ncbi:ankyrin repeat-containing domain protein [Hypoxylon cercidicola]|nr:ankyrin repeat-containing domain protein [Hypoxylon cercidicola]
MEFFAFGPMEVILIINSFLPGRPKSTSPYRVQSDTPYHDLASLARTSRKLYNRFNPILYGSNRDYDGSCLVFWAASHGRIETLERGYSFKLLLNPRIDVSTNFRANTYGYKTLPDGTKVVLDSTILLATAEGHEGTVAWLIAHGVETDNNSPSIGPQIGTGVRISPLLLALRLKQASIACLLIEKGSSLVFPIGVSLGSAIHVAAKQGLISVVRCLIQQGIDINTPDGRGDICLHHAVSGINDKSVITDLVALGADVNWIAGGTSPLSLAIQIGSFRIAHTLLDVGSNIHQTSTSGFQPIHMCTWDESKFPGSLDDQQYSLLKRLIALGADLNVTSRNNVSRTPLVEAIVNGSVETMQILIEAGADVRKPVHKMAPVGFAMGNLSKFALLLRNGIRLDRPYYERGSTLLLEIVKMSCQGSSRNVIEVKAILELASKKTVSDEHIDDALEYAVQLRGYSCCQALLSYGAKLQENRDVAGRWAHDLLIDRCRDPLMPGPLGMLLDFNLESDELDDLLTLALSLQDEAAVHVFLDRGVAGRHRNYRDPNVWLQKAADWGRVSILRRLLKASPNVNGFDSAGWLPLTRAVRADHRDAVLTLMDYGADAWLATKMAQVHFTTVQFAIRSGKAEILKDILEAQPGKVSEEDVSLSTEVIKGILREKGAL